MDKKRIAECLEISFKERIRFLDLVERLMKAGVERYETDLISMKKTYFGRDRETHIEAFQLDNPPSIPKRFSESKVKEALLDIRKGKIDYPEFLRRIMSAGTANYSVFIHGLKVVYMGRNGDFHVENFAGGEIPEKH